MATARLSLTPEQIQIVLFLRLQQQMPIARIAQKISCEVAAIESFLEQRRNSKPENQIATPAKRVRARRTVTPELRKAVLVMLRKNSILNVKRRFSLPHKLVRRISKEAKASFSKIGRGRRIGPELKKAILDRIRADARSVDLRKEFGISDWVVQKLRREIGDNENRLYRRGWDEAKVLAALGQGLSLTEVEKTCGIGHATLWELRRRLKDMEDRRRRGRPIPEAEKEAILADARQGADQRNLAEKYHRHTDRIRALLIEAKIPLRTPRLFTMPEVIRMQKMFAEGKSDTEIARELGCTRGAVWQRRRRARQSAEQGVAA